MRAPRRPRARSSAPDSIDGPIPADAAAAEASASDAAGRPQPPPGPERAGERPLLLAVESSCDETGVAVVEGGRRIVANVVASQVALHAATGGIVPEVAARAHLRWMCPVLDEAWADAGVAAGRTSTRSP